MKIKQKAISFVLFLIILLSTVLIIDFTSGKSAVSASSVPKSSELASNLLGKISKKSHPYILYEDSDLDILKEKISDGYSKKAFDFTKTTAKKYLSANITVSSSSAGIIGRQLQSYVAYLSIYGMLSGDDSYMTKAASLVNSAVKQGSVEIYDSINGALCVSDFGYAYALAYDWLYNYMTDSERAALKKEMEDIGNYIYTNSAKLGTWGSDEARRKAWNWNAVTHGALGMISVSLGTHNDWLTLSIERMKGYYTYSVDSTGAAMEGLHYIGYAMNTLAPLDFVIKDYTGVRLLDYYPNMQKLPTWSMMMTAPYGNEQAAIGQGSKLDNLAATYYIINEYSQSNALWGWERTYNLEGSNSFKSDYQGNGWNVPAIIFYENKSLEKKAPDSNTPLVNNYEKGQVIAVDGWSKSSSMMTFTSGYGYSGCWNHPDNNTFTFFANGESFVIDLGANYKKSSEHNVVQVDGTGMRYEGGSSMVEGEILANKLLQNGALYLKGDNSDSYNDSVLKVSTRQLIYKGGVAPYVIAFDHVESTSSTHKYTTSFYTDTASKIELVNSNVAKITGGNTGAVAYAFVYSPEGTSLSVAKTSATQAIVTENNAVTHNQITLYITANPDGSMPQVNFSTDSTGKIKLSVKYNNGEDFYTDEYTLSVSDDPSCASSKKSIEVTPYGTIPAEYASKADYPFVVFKSDKTFVGAYKDWAIDGKASALHSSKSSGSVILMRRNFEYKYTSQYNNLSQSGEKITVDLGGFTFTCANRSMFMAQKKTNTNTSLVIKNGYIILGPNALIRMDTGTQSGGVAYQGNNGFDFTFENVNISLSSKSTTDAVVCYNSFSADDPNQFCNLTFNNCAFDLRNASKDLVLFDMSDSHCRVSAKIGGGEIICSKYAVTFANTSNSNKNSILNFTKFEGAYTKITLPTGNDLPATSVNSGELSFVKISQGKDTATYQLTSSIISSYAPEMSITLSNELIVNVYIPKNYTEKFTLDGTAYENLNDFDGEAVTLEDGKEYYHISVPLPSSSASRDIKLSVTVTTGEATARAVFTLSIPKYAQKVLSGSNATAIEKTLVKDTLVYIREAYNYSGFNSHNTTAEIERVNLLINSIIGDYSSSPSISGVTKNADGISRVTFNLDAKPTIRFYVTDNSLKFYANGRKLNTVIGVDKDYGAYIELDVYAYVLAETIEYTGGGSYHISDFVSGSKGESHEALVRAFAKYVESSAEYRRAYLLQN